MPTTRPTENRTHAIELTKAALAGGVLSQVPTADLSEQDRTRAHCIYIIRMIGSLEMRLNELDGAQASKPK